MKRNDWKKEYNPVRRTAKRILSGEPLPDGRPLSDLIELDERTRRAFEFQASLSDKQVDMLWELGVLRPVRRAYPPECADCPYTLDEREHGVCRCCPIFEVGDAP